MEENTQGDLEFSTFVQILHKYFSAGKKPPEFIKLLIDNAIKDTAVNPLADDDDDLLRKYFNGAKNKGRDLSQPKASYILHNFDRDKFEGFIITLDEGLQEKLIRDLRKSFESVKRVKIEYLTQCCANIFYEIMEERAVER